MKENGEAKVDLFFSLRGQRVPVDHGYALYAAISQLLHEDKDGWLHRSDCIGIHPIRGRYLGNNKLLIEPASRLGFRVPVSSIPNFLPLAGKTFELDGHRLRIGVCTTHALQPVTAVYAHTVTTRNGQDETRFDEEVSRQLQSMDIKGRPERGERRVFNLKDKTIVGHSLLVSELTAEESIHLQEQGLGGRRKMGCGMFVPVPRNASR